jgi:protein-L-isoaspartate(D-aspartate) O-methyltransferase
MTRTTAARRAQMVQRDIVARGVRDPRVLDAIGCVPRERFVPPELVEFAYGDRPLPIGSGQTISQPFIVALMTEALELGPDDRVLEIGAVPGAAVLARVAAEVWTIERHAPLAEEARRVLADLGVTNVHVLTGDGTMGWPSAAPFDGIVVTAGGPDAPMALLEQLVEGGRLVIPVGAEMSGQRLVRFRRRGTGYVEDDLGPVQFVPLIGEQGW